MKPDVLIIGAGVPRKIEAARRLAMGPVIKCILSFDTTFWESEKIPSLADDAGNQLCFMHALDVDFRTWWTLRPLHVPILVGWVGGAPAIPLAALTDTELYERALASLAKIFGKRPRSLKKSIHASRISNWQTDPFSRGAYSYIPVGGETATRALAQPIDGKLFFAGEATHHGGLGGTVAGAIASGHRAAKQMLKAT